jgi:hypothetical protein
MRWRKQWKCGENLNAWGAVAGSVAKWTTYPVISMGFRCFVLENI